MKDIKEVEEQVKARLNKYEEVGMAQLSSGDTHVPCWIQIRPQPDAKHKIPSIKISNRPFVQGESEGVLVISISDAPVILAGKARFPTSTLDLVYKWISLNEYLLLKYWRKEINSTKAVLNGLKAL